MKVHEGLVRLGGVRIGESFHQGEFMGTTTTIDSINIESGYCAGVVLDWARRVLQSKSDREPSYLSYSTAGYRSAGAAGNLEPRQQSTLRRMAKAYAGQSSSYVLRTHKDCTLSALQLLLDEPEGDSPNLGVGALVSHATAKLLRAYWPDPVSPFDSFAPDYDPAGRLPHATIRELIRDLEDMPDAQLQGRVLAGREWANFAAPVDQRFNEIRSASGRRESKKPFGNLKVVKQEPAKTYDGPGWWLAVLTDHGGFKQDCCTVISFKKQFQKGFVGAVNP